MWVLAAKQIFEILDSAVDDRKTADVDISPVTLDGEETAEEGESVEVGISPGINGG